MAQSHKHDDPVKHDVRQTLPVKTGKDATDAEATDGVITIAEEQRARSAEYEANLGQPPEGSVTSKK